MVAFLNRINWTVTLFLVLNPLLSISLLLLHLKNHEIPLSIWVFALVFAAATNLSITAGYHRLLAHRSYEAHPIMKFFLLLIGASAFQGSALKWSSDHRRHHSQVDTDGDPYSIKKGFFYAHMGWMFLKNSIDLEIKAPDLEKDSLVRNQHKYYLFWSVGTGFLFPLLVGWLLGSAMAGLLIGGSLRIFLTQQSTFFVNSLCHTLGRQTYSLDISARDSLIVAFLTHGEGYHNFHHKFQLDYRNGILWYQWDPTKWVILFMKWLGLAKKLKTISSHEILRARLQVESMLIQQKGLSVEKINRLKSKILEAQEKWKLLRDDYEKLSALVQSDYSRKKLEWTESSQNYLNDMKTDMKTQIEQMKLQIRKAKSEFHFALDEWNIYLSFNPA